MEGLSPLAREILRAQELADLYGLTYGVYVRESGIYIAFPVGDTSMLGPVMKLGECESRDLVGGQRRLAEELESFMRTAG